MFPPTNHKNATINRLYVMFGCTYQAIAIFRIGFGILVTIELLLRYNYLHAFYGNNDNESSISSSSTLPISLLLNKVDIYYQTILCIPTYAYCYGTLFEIQLLLGLHIIISILITLGIYGSNILCCISWYLYFILTLRNTWLSYILDRYIHYLLFISIFLPLNQCYSINSYYYKRSNHSPSSSSSLSSSSGWYISPATIVLKLFLVWLYLDAGYGKYQNQGWSFTAYPLPALDTYARHTIIAQYITTMIGGTPGWRILTPLVVYIELGVVPITLFGLYIYNNTIIYTGIILIISLHLGIAATIRNAILLSFIAITPWLALLPITSNGGNNNRNKIHEKKATVANAVTVQWSSRTTTIISLLVLIPMILGCIWFETMSRSCDQSVKHIWSTLLHNRWNVFIGAEEYVTWEIAPGLLIDNVTYVDIWKDSYIIDWNLPTIQSGGAPSTATARPGRWRSFPYLANFTKDSNDYHALWGYLCKEWDRKHSPDQRLVKYNFFMLQADVLPNMEFSATRKRLIVSYDCSDAYIDRRHQNGSQITDFPKTTHPSPTEEPEQIESHTYRIELSPEPDFPKTATNDAHFENDEPERIRVNEHRIEMTPDSDFPKVTPEALRGINTNDIQPEMSQSRDCRVELSPEPDFPKTTIIDEVVDTQPEISHSECRIELSPEPDFPKTSTIPVVDTQPELSTSSEYRIELTPEPDFPKTTVVADSVTDEPDVEVKESEIRIELSP